jgi:hypothetical protein
MIRLQFWRLLLQPRPTPLREELDGPTVSAFRRAIAEVNQRWFSWKLCNMGDQKFLELLRASEGTLSRWSQLYLQSLAPTNSH